MKRLRSLVLGLFALCSMVGMAQEAEADDTGYIWGTERNGLTMDSTKRCISPLFIGVSER